MSKSNASALAFLQKTSVSSHSESFKESFEEVKPAVMSGFRGMFGDFKLGDKEKLKLQHILNEHFQPSSLPEEQVVEDYEELTRITSEIKAISAQSVLLHGDRIKKAQDLLKNYGDGAFTEWLMLTYGNRQTPYSMLRYFEFYTAIPLHAKLKIEHMPKKAAYILASRGADLGVKIKIIEDYNGETQKDMILLIEDIFPLQESDKRRKSSNESVFANMEDQIKKLMKRKAFFSESDKKTLASLLERFSKLISVD